MHCDVGIGKTECYFCLFEFSTLEFEFFSNRNFLNENSRWFVEILTYFELILNFKHFCIDFWRFSSNLIQIPSKHKSHAAQNLRKWLPTKHFQSFYLLFFSPTLKSQYTLQHNKWKIFFYFHFSSVFDFKLARRISECCPKKPNLFDTYGQTSVK